MNGSLFIAQLDQQTAYHYRFLDSRHDQNFLHHAVSINGSVEARVKTENLYTETKRLAEIQLDHVTYVLNTLRVNRFRKHRWFKEFIRCQREVSELEPDSYYAEAYRKEEICYWLHIPKCMFETKKSTELRRIVRLAIDSFAPVA
jgi:hypothetical protein